MSGHKHFFIVHSKEAPFITIDRDVDAIYVYFKRHAKVAKTIEREAKDCIINVDLDNQGEVIGIELIGITDFQISQMLKRARVRAPSINWEEAEITV